MLAEETLEHQLEAFSGWVKAHCKGNERAEAQTFLDRFFRVFGYAGALEAGAKFEDPQKKGSLKGRTGFMDCIFEDVVLIEMKKRGENLASHYSQLFNYWIYHIPRPKYAMLCNFDEFWIYDFNVQVDTPIQTLTLDELHKHPEALVFMRREVPKFNLNLVDITEQRAEQVGKVYKNLIDPKRKVRVSEEDAQRFILQCVLCLFAEDIGLLPVGFFTDLLEECKAKPEYSYDLISGLFRQMNTKQEATGGRYKGVRYFNGGLFEKIQPVELSHWELTQLAEVAQESWRGVRPSIFGTLFEQTMDPKERHAGGRHFTSELDIYKIVNPTIVRYWEEKIEAVEAKDTKNKADKLRALLKEIREYKVLDPACGSGNFLYVAFQELKRLEKKIMDLQAEAERNPDKRAALSLVSPKQFYGIDNKPFAVELAKLTLEIGRKVAVDRLNLMEDVLPLDNLDNNIICADALFTDWPQVDAIIGNPPFLGGKKLKSELGEEYVEKVYKAFPDVKGQPDFCVYWFRKAHDSQASRIGLVGTNSISQGQSRQASLEYVTSKNGFIHDAISTQVWSGEAKVHVSIVNWIRNKPKELILDEKRVPIINPSLKSEVDYTDANRLIQNLGKCFEACQLNGKGFIISKNEALNWIKKDPRNKEVLKPMIDGRCLINPSLELEWIIDFYGLTIEQAMNYSFPFNRVKELVKPLRDVNPDKGRRERWWLFGRSGESMRKAFVGLNQFFALPKVAKYTSFRPIDISIFPCEANMVVASDDFYILGVLNSSFHRNWVQAQCSTLEDRIRYTNTTCFETFPFLWDAPEKQKKPVRDIMQKLEDYRMGEMKQRNWGITQLYNAFFNEPASQLYKLHRQLDEVVCKVYGWPYDPDKNYNPELYALNQELYKAEQKQIAPAKKPRKIKSKTE